MTRLTVCIVAVLVVLALIGEAILLTLGHDVPERASAILQGLGVVVVLAFLFGVGREE